MAYLKKHKHNSFLLEPIQPESPTTKHIHDLVFNCILLAALIGDWSTTQCLV